MAVETPLTTPEVAVGLIWRMVDDNVVVVSPDTGDVHVLSHTGAVVWQMLADKKEMNDIKSHLINHYTISPEQANQDVATFISTLKQEELLR